MTHDWVLSDARTRTPRRNLCEALVITGTHTRQHYKALDLTVVVDVVVSCLETFMCLSRELRRVGRILDILTLSHTLLSLSVLSCPLYLSFSSSWSLPGMRGTRFTTFTTSVRPT